MLYCAVQLLYITPQYIYSFMHIIYSHIFVSKFIFCLSMRRIGDFYFWSVCVSFLVFLIKNNLKKWQQMLLQIFCFMQEIELSKGNLQKK